MKLIEDFLTEVKKHDIYVLARDSGVSRITIANWIYKRNCPTLIKAQAVADAMGMEFLLFDKE